MSDNTAVCIDFENTVSLNGNLWKFAPYNENTAELIASKYGLSITIAGILAARGVKINEIDCFLHPKIQNLMPDPVVLKDMEKASQKIAKAIINKETIALIGDYDVDGATFIFNNSYEIIFT